MTEDNDSDAIEVQDPALGWLDLLSHRVKTFCILGASLVIDAAFMLFWLVIHGLFTITANIIERWLNNGLHTPTASAVQSSSAQPFKAVFFITISLLDVAAFAIMIYFIYTDVRTFWKKISSQNETTLLTEVSVQNQVKRSSITAGVQIDD